MQQLQDTQSFLKSTIVTITRARTAKLERHFHSLYVMFMARAYLIGFSDLAGLVCKGQQLLCRALGLLALCCCCSSVGLQCTHEQDC